MIVRLPDTTDSPSRASVDTSTLLDWPRYDLSHLINSTQTTKSTVTSIGDSLSNGSISQYNHHGNPVRPSWMQQMLMEHGVDANSIAKIPVQATISEETMCPPAHDRSLSPNCHATRSEVSSVEGTPEFGRAKPSSSPCLQWKAEIQKKCLTLPDVDVNSNAQVQETTTRGRKFQESYAIPDRIPERRRKKRHRRKSLASRSGSLKMSSRGVAPVINVSDCHCHQHQNDQMPTVRLNYLDRGMQTERDAHVPSHGDGTSMAEREAPSQDAHDLSSITMPNAKPWSLLLELVETIRQESTDATAVKENPKGFAYSAQGDFQSKENNVQTEPAVVHRNAGQGEPKDMFLREKSMSHGMLSPSGMVLEGVETSLRTRPNLLSADARGSTCSNSEKDLAMSQESSMQVWASPRESIRAEDAKSTTTPVPPNYVLGSTPVRDIGTTASERNRTEMARMQTCWQGSGPVLGTISTPSMERESLISLTKRSFSTQTSFSRLTTPSTLVTPFTAELPSSNMPSSKVMEILSRHTQDPSYMPSTSRFAVGTVESSFVPLVQPSSAHQQQTAASAERSSQHVSPLKSATSSPSIEDEKDAGIATQGSLVDSLELIALARLRASVSNSNLKLWQQQVLDGIYQASFKVFELLRMRPISVDDTGEVSFLFRSKRNLPLKHNQQCIAAVDVCDDEPTRTGQFETRSLSATVSPMLHNAETVISRITTPSPLTTIEGSSSTNPTVSPGSTGKPSLKLEQSLRSSVSSVFTTPVPLGGVPQLRRTIKAPTASSGCSYETTNHADVRDDKLCVDTPPEEPVFRFVVEPGGLFIREEAWMVDEAESKWALVSSEKESVRNLSVRNLRRYVHAQNAVDALRRLSPRVILAEEKLSVSVLYSTEENAFRFVCALAPSMSQDIEGCATSPNELLEPSPLNRFLGNKSLVEIREIHFFPLSSLYEMGDTPKDLPDSSAYSSISTPSPITLRRNELKATQTPAQLCVVPLCDNLGDSFQIRDRPHGVCPFSVFQSIVSAEGTNEMTPICPEWIDDECYALLSQTIAIILFSDGSRQEIPFGDEFLDQAVLTKHEDSSVLIALSFAIARFFRCMLLDKEAFSSFVEKLRSGGIPRGNEPGLHGENLHSLLRYCSENYGNTFPHIEWTSCAT